MTFKQWLATRNVTQNPRGDFLDDAKGDSSFPEVHSKDQLETYLASKSACSEAVVEALKLWRQYAKSYL